MKDSFYSAFEKKYRGSREQIGARLEAYIPTIAPLLDIYPQASALDLGCGRGEWLEMVSRMGFDARGVDLDEGMLSYCTELNLKAEKAEAIASLKALPDESIALISSFHLVEHIGFENVRSLINESLRVLKPGGLLILETPNAENLQVGTHTFHLDPTHDKPIPHQLLEFVAEYAGFHRTKIMRLQEPGHISLENEQFSLTDVLLSVSPDYSVVAQKVADEAILAQFDTPFATRYGVSLIEMANAYDDRIQHKEDAQLARVQTMQEEITELKTNLDRVESFSSSGVLEAKIRLEYENQQLALANKKLETEKAQLKAALELERDELEAALGFKNNQIKAALESENEQLKAALEQKTREYIDVSTAHHHVVYSRSWKMTKPYRFAGQQFRYVAQHGPVNRSKQIIKRILVALNHRLNRYPDIKAKLVKGVKKAGLEKIARRIYVKAQSTPHVVSTAEVLQHQDLVNQLHDPALLPVEVKEIFSKLK